MDNGLVGDGLARLAEYQAISKLVVLRQFGDLGQAGAVRTRIIIGKRIGILRRDALRLQQGAERQRPAIEQMAGVFLDEGKLLPRGLDGFSGRAGDWPRSNLSEQDRQLVELAQRGKETGAFADGTIHHAPRRWSERQFPSNPSLLPFLVRAREISIVQVAQAQVHA